MDSSQLSKGAILQGGKYRIESVLGQGGFGITYLATQELLDRKVAIKEFFMRDFCSREGDTSSVTLGTASNRETMERYLNKFLKEARTIAALTHPNIIQIHDIFKENNTAYYVMEYIEGESLSQLVKHRGALPESEAVKYIRAVAEALKYVHERKINHLDVKPGNIMLRHADNRVFLLDFGLSKQYDAEGNQTSSTPVGISHGYAPIEQYKPGGVKEFSPQTDIYALGATLYYLVTGMVPPSATDLFETELAYPETLSAPVCNAIRQAMKLQKRSRPQSVDLFLALLKDEKQEEDEKKLEEMVSAKVGLEDTVIKQAKTSSSEPVSPKVKEADVEKRSSEKIKPVEKPKKEQKEQRTKGSAKVLGWFVALALAIGGIGISAWLLCPSAAEKLYAKAEKAYNTKDYVTAFELYKQAVEEGSIAAMCDIGIMYEYGRGISKNESEAVKWYRKAAERGDARGQYCLGDMYKYGIGVVQDRYEAMNWYAKAAEQGNEKAQQKLNFLLLETRADNMVTVTEDGNNIESSFHKIGNQLFSSEYNEKQNTQHIEKEEFNLGVESYNNEDYESAFKHFSKAANQGHADAQYYLGILYEYGKGVTQSYTLALSWYRKAAKQNHKYALKSIGVMYEFGQGVIQNKSEAIKWYRKAAEQGDEYAKNALRRLEE